VIFSIVACRVIEEVTRQVRLLNDITFFDYTASANSCRRVGIFLVGISAVIFVEEGKVGIFLAAMVSLQEMEGRRYRCSFS
jgi:hypothetical protein